MTGVAPPWSQNGDAEGVKVAGMLVPEYPDAAGALFFDFDGTLVDIAPQPEAVRTPAQLPRLLARLSGALGGALAIVSGRTVAEIDEHLQPLKLCVAGVHGAERRGADGYIRRISGGGALHDAEQLLTALVQGRPGLRLEIKPGALALHYRQRPDLEDECVAAMNTAIQRSDGMALLRGKMVVEMKPRRAGKGVAVRSFLDERPFRMRRPWFFGDDVTDEAAFEMVQSLGGVAVKIGVGDTLAAHRLPDPAALLGWLQQAAESLAVPAQRVTRT